MFEKFLSLFMKRNAAKRRITMPEPPVEETWADIHARVMAERPLAALVNQPLTTGTPYARIHELIGRGWPDDLIAFELGVEISAVRTYRDIIGAKARHQARQRAAEARVPAMLARGELDEDIAAELRLPLLTVQNIRTYVAGKMRRGTTSSGARASAQTHQADASQRSGIDAIVPLSAALTAPLFMNQSHAAPCPAPSPDVSSGGGDFGGGGASGTY